MLQRSLWVPSLALLWLFACTAPNTLPTLQTDSFVGEEDQDLVIPFASLLANDQDETTSSLVVASVQAAEHGLLIVSAQEVTFRPENNYHGPASFRYTASDGELSAEGFVSLEIASVEDAPLAVDDAFDLAQNLTLSLPSTTLLANDSDADGDTLSMLSVSSPISGIVSLDNDFVLFVPETDFVGLAGFDYTITDQNSTSTAHVNISVNQNNVAPVATDDAASTDEDVLLTLDTSLLVENDADVETAVLTVQEVFAAVHGSVSLDANTQLVSFLPEENFHGTAQFSYVVTDGVLTDSAVVVVTVNSVNDAPHTVDDDLRSSPLVSGVSTLLDNTLLFANDSDVDTNQDLFFVAEATSDVLFVSILSNFIDVTPPNNFVGDTSLLYTLSDGIDTSTAVVLLSVQAPVCGDGAIDGPETCDDGNATSGDGCSSSCVAEFCGDGIVNNGGTEQCDDGNNLDNDACRNTCQTIKTIQIVSGARHSCVVSELGTVRCWGDNSRGQLGYEHTRNIGDNESPLQQATVDVGELVTQLAAGESHTCALLTSGTVRCWGDNTSGQLGYGNTETIGDDETPSSVGDVDVGGVVMQITAGARHTCALLQTGNVRCWGDAGRVGTGGQLGHGNTVNIGDNETPASAGDVNIGGTATQVSAGGEHTCALLSTGNVRCWGVGSLGQLGYGNTNSIGDNEAPAVAGNVNVGGPVVQLVAASAHTCALLAGGAVRCWGDGKLLGYGNVNNVGDNEVPSSAGDVLVGAPVTTIATGYQHTCALLVTGGLRCWGLGTGGRLGYGNQESVGDDEVPALAGDVFLGEPVRAVSTGLTHSCALLESANVRCWGVGESGQLGYGDMRLALGDDESPLAESPLVFSSRVVQVVSGVAHTCALLEDGSVRCWGRGAEGQLGRGTAVTLLGDDEAATTLSEVPLGGAAVQLAAGGFHTCALLVDGSVRCWGVNSLGQLGYGNTETIGDDETPASVGSVDVGGIVTQIVAGGAHTCALLVGGTVRCWGAGDFFGFGQLGYGNTQTIGDDETPASVGDVNVGSPVQQLAAGLFHTCALRVDGLVQCWGSAESGQLGYGNTNNIGDNETPVSAGTVSLADTALQIEVGNSHSCALLSNGSVQCWGSATSGQLCNGNTLTIGDDELPSAVGPLVLDNAAAAIALGGEHTCALLSDGYVQCWGSGASGQLGAGDTQNFGDDETLQSILNLELADIVVDIVAGDTNTCVVYLDGSLQCWGDNQSAQLGTGSLRAFFGDDELPSVLGSVLLF